MARFLLVGLTTVAIDYAAYLLLLSAGIAISPAKAAGFVCGAVFAFFANREFTFAAPGRRYAVPRFAAVYLASLAANVAVNRLGLMIAPGQILPAFLAATALSAAMNFTGMKLFVFKQRGSRG